MRQLSRKAWCDTGGCGITAFQRQRSTLLQEFYRPNSGQKVIKFSPVTYVTLRAQDPLSPQLSSIRKAVG
jgi:hypothetical protein